jgi:hypothetical protein
METLYGDPVLSLNHSEDQPNNKEGYSYPRVGHNKINKFLSDNNLNHIIRAREPVSDGIQSQNSIITIISATNYGGELKN